MGAVLKGPLFAAHHEKNILFSSKESSASKGEVNVALRDNSKGKKEDNKNSIDDVQNEQNNNKSSSHEPSVAAGAIAIMETTSGNGTSGVVEVPVGDNHNGESAPDGVGVGVVEVVIGGEKNTTTQKEKLQLQHEMKQNEMDILLKNEVEDHDEEEDLVIQ